MQRPSWVEVAVTAVIIALIVFVLARGKASTAHAPQDQSRKERVVTPARHAAPHAAGERVPPALPQVTDTDEPPAQTQTLKVTHASVRIVFEGDAPRPLTGKAQLSAEDRLGVSGWQSLSMPVEHTRSVVFTDVNPCDCSVIVRLSSYMEMRTNFSLAAYVGQQATVVFALEPQWTLRGVIRDRDTSDSVQGAHVNLHSTDPYVRTYEAFSDGRGEFDCAELAFPRARVTIAHPWYPTQTVSLVQQPPDADRLVFTLCRGARITGRVTDESGSPVADHEVYIAGRIDPNGPFFPSGDKEGTHSDASGSFTLEHVAPRKPFTRVIADSGCSNGYADLALETGDERDVTLIVRSITNAPPVLKVTARFTNGSPVRNLDIRIVNVERYAGGGAFRSARHFAHWSDDGVHYAQADPGIVPVTVWCENYAPVYFSNLLFKLNCTTEVSVVMAPPTAELVGHAERANGTPAPGIDLVASAAACEFETTTSCDQNGDFAFKSILPDTAYSIRSGNSDGIEVAEPAQPVDLGQPVRVVLKPYSAITFWGSISNTLKAVNTVSYIISHTPVEHPRFDSLYGTDLKLSINAPWSGDCYFYVTAAGCRPKSYHFNLKPDEDVDLGTIWFEKEE
ncbi:carboxypeptidase regulatory-like domain-containing protein [bacterium]|nr:carboxypeptidase regulatory-like domain-containing protein [bacterium]